MAAGDSSLNLLINISAVNGASAVISQVAQSLSSLAGGGAMGAIATAAVAAGAAVVGIGASAAKSAGDFQQSMSQLITSAGEAKSNIQSVSDGILKMSVDTGTSTQQLGSAMYYVESSGQHGAAALQELTAAAQGAKTENADLTTVTKALTTVMTDYHLPVQDSTAAMNGLIAIVKNGRTNLQDLSSSMGAVLPVASSMGISFPQVGGAMDVMTNAGLSSQQAAQNLAHVLVALQAPSKVAQSSMQEVGLSAQQVRDALVSQGLPEAFQMIEDHVSKKFPAGSVQAETALKNILGGLVGLKTAAMFTGDSLQAAEQDTKNITDAFDHAGSAVDGWDTVQQNFNFQLDRVQAALNVFMITLGQQLLPILTPIVKGFADLVSGISNFIGSLGNAKDPGDAFVKTLSSLGVNAQTARDIFNDLQTTFKLVGDIIGNVGNILQTTFGTTLKIVGGLIVAFINGPLGDIIQGFNAVLSGIADFTQNLSKNLQTTFDGLSADAETWGQNFMIGFENGIIAIASDIIAVVEQVAQDIADYLGFGSPTKKGPGSTLDSWGRGMMTGLAQGITAASPIVVDAVTGVAAQLQQAATSGGTLHSAVASMIDPTSGDAMTASITPDQTVATTTTATTAKSAATSGLTTVASAVTKSTTAITSAIAHSTATTAAAVSTAATKVASCSSPASTCATKAAEAAKAQKAASSAASTKQRATLASQAAQQRQQAAQQRQQAAAQRQAASQQSAKQHAEAQAKRDQIRQELAQQRAQAQAAKAAAKAGPPAVAGATPVDWTKALKPITDINNEANKLNTTFQNIGKNAKLMADNISTSFTGVQAKAQQIAADLKPFGDWLVRTFAPVWQTIAYTWTSHIVPAWNDVMAALKPAMPSLQDIVKIFGELVAIALVTFLEQVAAGLRGVAALVGALADGLDTMITGWLWVVQQLQPILDAIVAAFQWLYDTLIGHSIIPDIVNGVKNWFNQLIDFFPNLMRQVKNTLSQWWNQIKADVTTFWQNVGAIFSSAYQTWIAKPLASIGSALTTWWNTQKTAWATLAKDLWAAVQGIFNGAYTTQLAPALVKIGQSFSSWFTTEATQFGTWATNLMIAFGKSITSGITTYITPAVTAVANTIKSFLGIASPAQTGPLSTADQWMPNLMNMFAKQIAQKEPAITNQVAQFAQGIAQKFSELKNSVQQNSTDINASLTNIATQVSSAKSRLLSDMNALATSMNSNLNSMNNSMNQQQNSVNNWSNNIQNKLNNTNNAINNAANNANNAANQVNKDASNVDKSTQQIHISVDKSGQDAQKAAQDANVAALALSDTIKSAQNALVQSGLTVQQRNTALQNAQAADNYAYKSSISAGQSQAQAITAAKNAYTSSIQASISADQATNATQSLGQAATAAQKSMQAAGMSQQQQQSAMTAAVQAYNSADNAALSNGASTQYASQAGMHAFESSIKDSEAAAHAQASKASANNAGTNAQQASTFAQQSTSGAKTAQQGSDQAQQSAGSSIVSTKTVATSLKSSDSTLQEVVADQSSAAQAAKAMIAMAQNAAAQVHALMGIFSPSKEGPLSTSDQWMPNLMQMFMSGLNSKQSALKNASTIAAQGVKDAFQDAAVAAGASLISLKQKGDDIYATIAALAGGTPGTPGTAGTAAQYALETANVRGDIPIQYMITPPTPGTPGTSGSSTTQNMTVHIDLDGKTIGKYVGKYVSKEVRVQGGVRNS